MKSIIIPVLMLILLAFTTYATDSYLQTNIIRAWNLSEAAPTLWKDQIVGDSAEAFLNIDHAQAGIHDKAIRIQPSPATSWIEIGSNITDWDSTVWSVALWVKRESDNPANYDGIVTNRNGGTGHWTTGLEIDSSGDDWYHEKSGGNNINTGISPPSQFTEWYLVTTTHNLTHSCIYVNASLFGCASVAGNNMGGTTNILTLGRWFAGDSAFRGLYDELMIFNVSLTQTEIEYLWNNGTGNFYPFLQPTTTFTNEQHQDGERATTQVTFNITISDPNGLNNYTYHSWDIGQSLAAVDSFWEQGNGWHHYALVVNNYASTADRMKIYKNNVDLDLSYTKTYPYDNPTGTPLPAYSSHIVGANVGASTDDCCYGIIDNIKVYDYAKTDFSDSFLLFT